MLKYKDINIIKFIFLFSVCTASDLIVPASIVELSVTFIIIKGAKQDYMQWRQVIIVVIISIYCSLFQKLKKYIPKINVKAQSYLWFKLRKLFDLTENLKLN